MATLWICYRNVLGRLLPPYIQKRISKKPEVWEQIVHTEHKKHTGKPLMIVELLFLQPLRGLPYYGYVQAFIYIFFLFFLIF
jgi:hypothetical protein